MEGIGADACETVCKVYKLAFKSNGCCKIVGVGMGNPFRTRSEFKIWKKQADKRFL